MTKRCIGIEFDAAGLRVAVAEVTKAGPILVEAEAREISPSHSLEEALAQVLAGLNFGDRVVAALPAVGSFFRKLNYPFADPTKIEAAISLDLASQLPVDDALICDFQTPQPQEQGFQVTAAAVRQAVATDFCRPFAAAGVPLQTLDLSPFAYAAGLRQQLREGLLALVAAREASVARIRNGQVIDLRSFPIPEGKQPAAVAEMVGRTCLALAQPDDERLPPLLLLGTGATDGLIAALGAAGWQARRPELAIDGRPVAADLLQAAALALRGALPPKERQFNFLKGNLAPRSEWAVFRRQLIAAAVLAGLTLTAAGSAAYLNLAQKNSRAEALRQEVTAVFRQTFPKIQTIVDAQAQMGGELAKLREQARILGLGRERSALGVLREISARTPADTSLEVRELIYSGDQLRIEGVIASFEAINRLAQNLEAPTIFEAVQIADAKTSADGSQVDFRLSLKLSAAEASR